MIGITDVEYSSAKAEFNIYGKVVHIIGADDERAESKIRGPTFAGAYVDEATIIPESVFKMLISRCAMGGAKIFATTNPDSPYHWLKRDYLDNNSDVKSWQFVLDDNPKLEEKEKDYLRRQYRGLWYQRFIEGKWVQAEGAIYDFFDPVNHVIDNAPGFAQYYIAGVDYGTTNPCAFVLIGINPNKFPNMWVEDEYYFDSKVHQRQKTDSEYAEDLIRFLRGRCSDVKAIYLDPSAVSFRVELQRCNVRNIYEADNEVLDGIRKVGDLLNTGTFKICRKCANLIKEFGSYVWDAKSRQTGVDKPVKQSDHALDALRYALYTSLKNRPLKGMEASDTDRYRAEAYGYGPELPEFTRQPIDYPSGGNPMF